MSECSCESTNDRQTSSAILGTWTFVGQLHQRKYERHTILLLSMEHKHTHTGRALKLIAEVQIEMVRNAIISHQIWPVDGSSGRLRDGSSIFGDTPRLANLFSFPMDPAVDIHRKWGSNKGRSFRSNVTSIDSLYFLAR